MDVLLCTASIWHMCTMSVDRYCTLRYPISYGRSRTRTSVGLKIAFVWVISTAVCAALAVTGFADYSSVYVDRQCVPSIKEFVLYGSVLAFYVPLVIMIVTYVLTVRILRENRRAMKSIGLHPSPVKGKLGENRKWKKPNQSDGSPDAKTRVNVRQPERATFSVPLRRKSTIPENVSLSGMTVDSLTAHLRSAARPSVTDRDGLDSDSTSASDRFRHRVFADERRRAPQPAAVDPLPRRSDWLDLRCSAQPKTVDSDEAGSRCHVSSCSPTGRSLQWHGRRCRRSPFQFNNRDISAYCCRSFRATGPTNTPETSPLIEYDRERQRRLSDGALYDAGSTSRKKFGRPVNFSPKRCSPFCRRRQHAQPVELCVQPENSDTTLLPTDSRPPESEYMSLNSCRSVAGDADVCWSDGWDRDPTRKLSGDFRLQPDAADSLGTTRPPRPHRLKLEQPKRQRIKSGSFAAEGDRLAGCLKSTKEVTGSRTKSRNDKNLRLGSVTTAVDNPWCSWSPGEPYLTATDCSLTLSSASHSTTDRIHMSSLSAARALRRRSTATYRLTSTTTDPLSACGRRRSIATNERKASKVLGIIFAVFVVLWTPFFVVNVLSVTCDRCLDSLGPAAMSSLVWLGYVSSLANPIVYTMFSTSFRTVFGRILTCKLCSGRTRRGSHWASSRTTYQLARQTTVGDGVNSGR